jgi:hypothetical protein
MFRSTAAEQLYNELVQRLPAFMSRKAAAAELNQGLTQTSDDIKTGRLESFVEPGTRKRNITGRSVARRAAEKLDAALAVGAVPKFTEKATTASLASRRKRACGRSDTENAPRKRGRPPKVRPASDPASNSAPAGTR